MVSFSVQALFFVLTALVGVFHVWSPDHWLPLSVVSWQKRWSFLRTTTVWTLACALHCALGLVLALAAAPALRLWDGSSVFLLSLGLVLLMTLLRSRRLSRLQEVLRSGTLGRWGVYVTIGLLGPAELMLPIAVKGQQLDLSSALLFKAAALFSAATWAAGLGAVLVGRSRWDVPMALPLAVSRSTRQVSSVPFLVSLGVGLSIFMQASAG